jgi:hypothetical protein
MGVSNFSIASAMSVMGPLARQNLFLFEINKVPSGGNAEDIRFAVEKASVPQSKNDPMKVPWMNSEYKIPGITTYEPISIDLRISEQNNMRIYDTIYNWYKMIYDPATGIQMVPKLTMTDAKVSLLNYQGKTIKTWDIMHIFPTSCGGTSLSRDSGDKQVMAIEFAYTYATLGGGSGGGGLGGLIGAIGGALGF